MTFKFIAKPDPKCPQFHTGETYDLDTNIQPAYMGGTMSRPRYGVWAGQNGKGKMYSSIEKFLEEWDVVRS